MDSTSKALIMAAGVLLGILILSLMVYYFTSLSGFGAMQKAREQAIILERFNSEYVMYDRKDLKISDIVSVANLAKNNNKKNAENDENDVLYVKIFFQGLEIQENTVEKNIEFLENDTGNSFKCINIKYNNGRISEMYFSKNI